MTKEEVRVAVNLYVFGQQFDALIDWIWRLEQENEKLRATLEGKD